MLTIELNPQYITDNTGRKISVVLPMKDFTTIMEELHLIKLMNENFTRVKTKLSDKYKGVFSENDAKSFDEHTRIMREEWNTI